MDSDRTLLERWAHRALAVLEDQRGAINSLNVFPIPDGDTGNNLLATLRAAVAELDADGSADPHSAPPAAAALARGAVRGARGNSGVIVAQILRGIADAVAASGRLDARTFAAALTDATALVERAITVPVEGTVLTVLRTAARVATAELPVGADSGRPGLLEVSGAAAEAARGALADTTGQLRVLAEHGVVDAGAFGFVLLLDEFVRVLGGSRPALDPPSAALRPSPSAPRMAEPRFEVMYLLERTTPERVDALRSALGALGESVVIVADGQGPRARWSVHVHTDEVGPAIEAGLAAGDASAIRVDAFDLHAPQGVSTAPRPLVAAHPPLTPSRVVLAIAEGDGTAALFRDEGAAVLRAEEGITRTQLIAELNRLPEREVIVVANGALPPSELVGIGAASVVDDRDVVVIPSASPVQGLAALAVHDASAPLLDAVYSMSQAASNTRWGSVRVATERALTYVGTCEPGDGLGLMGQEVVVIDPAVRPAAERLLDLAVGTGAELVTLLTGADAAPAVVDGLAEYVRGRYPGVEVSVYAGGQPGELLALGIE